MGSIFGVLDNCHAIVGVVSCNSNEKLTRLSGLSVKENELVRTRRLEAKGRRQFLPIASSCREWVRMGPDQNNWLIFYDIACKKLIKLRAIISFFAGKRPFWVGKVRGITLENSKSTALKRLCTEEL